MGDITVELHSDMTPEEWNRAMAKLEEFGFATRAEKKGEWILQSDDYHEYYECDQCGIAIGLDDIRNFCPNCGARMEESE